MINRRDLAKFAGMTAAGISLAGCASKDASPEGLTPHTSFASLKHVDAGVLNVGYAEDGPPTGQPVILLHGWPYDIHSYVDVAPALAARGYRVIVPFLRGYGTTTFRSADAFRNGQQSVVAVDVVALMDALKIPKAIIGGFDWGSRTAAIIGALWPDRCKALVAVSGYLIINLQNNLKPLPPESEYGWWYQYYLEAGLAAVELQRRHIPAHSGSVHQSGPRRHRHPQLPLAVEPGQRRAAVRPVGAAPIREAGDRRTDRHDCERLRRVGHGRQVVPKSILGQILSPHSRRHRPQCPSRSAARVCERDRRCGRDVRGIGCTMPVS
jgi:pimeloyl-ACP methyl ester carboxylesterase